MLQPRETDIPALFLVFIVLPLVTYILLGKWSETSKKKDRISILAQQAAEEEAIRVETMVTANVFPLLPLHNNANHHCAKCYGPAATRCSRCKSIWYCSGRCQIIHWREVHKHECQQLDSSCGNSSPKPSIMGEVHEKVLFDGSQSMTENIPPEDINLPVSGSIRQEAADCITDNSSVPVAERSSLDRRPSRKVTLRRGNVLLSGCSGQASESGVNSSRMSCDALFKETAVRHKLRESHTLPSSYDIHDSAWTNSENGNSRCTLQENHNFQKQMKHEFDSRNSCGISNPSNAGSCGMKPCNSQVGRENVHKKETAHDESAGIYSSSERGFMKRNNKAKSTSHSQSTKVQKLPKTTVNLSREQSCPGLDFKGLDVNDSRMTRTKDVVPSQGKDGVSGIGIMKMIGLMKPSKHDIQEDKLLNANRDKKRKMLFPYDEFVKFFQCESFSMSPRGLVNCGNSCYANAVLQCLSCTKPLINFLLRRSHSRACCVRDWCLMCELEQHVMMLRERGGPLSPSRILSHIRSINCQIGDGSQEDAHEFLRFLVASMQSISLESLGGENVVDPRLQETTFIQHTFGGRLRSKVICLRCHHESQRSENIMDLTLEIFGWVESLEDALTQFTSPENLDGENMYRCSRCATYVQARKQLSIQEAPNILTIVLKRFQEGSYGKINKCISFPDMLDMVPFMTGTDDVPPLYMLYGVVVHLDTLNASFSGHYISYVKNMQGNWFRIDDTEVQPVEMNQVMSEGAYILFYMRSSPRPARGCTLKTSSPQVPSGIPRQCPSSRSQRHSKPEESRLKHCAVKQESLLEPIWDRRFANYSSNASFRSTNGRSRQATEARAQPIINHEFSDAASSDWSIFTSSDEASFTTESTRDSFSTVDHADASNMDLFSSILNSLYASSPPQKTIACNMFSSSKSQTMFFAENIGPVWECYMPEASFSTAEEAYGDVAACRQGQPVTYGSSTTRESPQYSVKKL